MKRINAKDRWKTLVQRALNQDSRMDMIVLNEWQKYSKPEIDLLIQLNDPEISLDSIKSQNDIHQIFFLKISPMVAEKVVLLYQLNCLVLE